MGIFRNRKSKQNDEPKSSHGLNLSGSSFRALSDKDRSTIADLKTQLLKSGAIEPARASDHNPYDTSDLDQEVVREAGDRGSSNIESLPSRDRRLEKLIEEQELADLEEFENPVHGYFDSPGDASSFDNHSQAAYDDVNKDAFMRPKGESSFIESGEQEVRIKLPDGTYISGKRPDRE